MNNIAIFIKNKNSHINDLDRDENIKTMLYYGLDVRHEDIYFYDYYYNDLETYYYNLDAINELQVIYRDIDIHTVYIYVENGPNDLLDNTYASIYFYKMFDDFNTANLFFQYAGALAFNLPILKTHVSYDNDNIIVDTMDVDIGLISSVFIIDNLLLDDMLLNLLEFDEDPIDLFSFIINNQSINIYANKFIGNSTYIFDKPDSKYRHGIFHSDRNILIRRILYSIYSLTPKKSGLE